MDELVTPMGLMLKQRRYARRALDDIERLTSHYAGFGFAFAGAMQGGGAAMAPPPGSEEKSTRRRSGRRRARSSRSR